MKGRKLKSWKFSAGDFLIPKLAFKNHFIYLVVYGHNRYGYRCYGIYSNYNVNPRIKIAQMGTEPFDIAKAYTEDRWKKRASNMTAYFRLFLNPVDDGAW